MCLFKGQSSLDRITWIGMWIGWVHGVAVINIRYLCWMQWERVHEVMTMMKSDIRKCYNIYYILFPVPICTHARAITMSIGKRFASAITHRTIRDRWHHRGSWLGPDEYGWGAYNPIHCIWADNEIIIISIVLAAIEIAEHRLLALDKRCRLYYSVSSCQSSN